MPFSIFHIAARSRLGTKSTMAVVILISAISIMLTLFFVTMQERSMTEELEKRALSLASNLAYNSQLSVISSDISSLQTLFNGVKQESDIEEAFITDMEGVILAHTDTTKIGEQIYIPADSDSLTEQWIPTDDNNIWRTITLIELERNPADAGEFILFSSPEESGNPDPGSPQETYIEKLGFAVLDVSLGSMNRELSTATRHAVIITLIMILAGALAVIYMVRTIADPIYHLADATREVAQGDLEQTVPIKRSDEIGILADSFNNMMCQLKASREKIEAWNRELEIKVTERTAELEEKHNELEKAYEVLKTLDKAKDDFLSLVSHELRTPLSSILLYSEMLLDGLANSEEDRTEFLTTIVDNCKRLTRLINDVLDLSKIEAGRMSFNQEKLNGRELVAETLSSIRPALESRGLTFQYEDVKDDIHFWGDRDKIIQVFTNITSNAIKFTPKGGSITVGLSKNNKYCIVSVTDIGKGIKKK